MTIEVPIEAESIVSLAGQGGGMRRSPYVLWFTGLSGAGKSTMSLLVQRRLEQAGQRTYLLDGDNLRGGLCRDLGYTAEARAENIRRAVEVAHLMTDAGLIVLAAFISPFREERALARARFAPGRFIEIHVDVPLAVAESRDPKGLYRKARSGALRDFTGIDSPYEAPLAPELRLGADAAGADELADRVIAYLKRNEYL